MYSYFLENDECVHSLCSDRDGNPTKCVYCGMPACLIEKEMGL